MSAALFPMPVSNPPTPEELDRAVKLGRFAEDDILQAHQLRDRALHAAVEAFEQEWRLYEKRRAKLEAYDNESERLIAANLAEIQSLKARISFIREHPACPGEVPPEPRKLEELERRLRQAEHEETLLGPQRLKRRQLVSHRVRVAVHRAAETGRRAWRLQETRLESLEAISRAGRRAAEMLAQHSAGRDVRGTAAPGTQNAPGTVLRVPGPGGASVHTDHAQP